MHPVHFQEDEIIIDKRRFGLTHFQYVVHSSAKDSAYLEDDGPRAWTEYSDMAAINCKEDGAAAL